MVTGCPNGMTWESNCSTPPVSLTANANTATVDSNVDAKVNFTLLLKKGSRGNEVMELQKLLNDSGYNSGIADGIFGLKTKSAVIKFQIANKLIGDGIVGRLTRAILNK